MITSLMEGKLAYYLLTIESIIVEYTDMCSGFSCFTNYKHELAEIRLNIFYSGCYDIFYIRAGLQEGNSLVIWSK